MKLTLLNARPVLASAQLALLAAAVPFAGAARGQIISGMQDRGMQNQGIQNPQYPDLSRQQPQAPDLEVQAAGKVESAGDAAAKLDAATDFMKKFPKSTLIKPVAQRVAAKIAEVPDSAQKITLCENYLNLFKDHPAEADLIVPVALDAYVKADRIDDAFQRAAGYLERNPDDVPTLTQMSIVGVEQLRHNNSKYVGKVQQYGNKAVALIETGARPAALTDAQWADYKTRWLAQLYQSLGLTSLVTGNSAEAKTRLEKALSINPSDPFTYVLLGGIADGQYQKTVGQYKSMSPGPDQDQTLKRALSEMDQVIDLFAHALALSEGNAGYQVLHDHVLESVQPYYKYRHNGSTDGLQQLIDKYKKSSGGH